MISADSCNATSSSASVITHSQSQIKAFPSTDEQKKIVPDERLTHTGNHKSQEKWSRNLLQVACCEASA